MVDKLHGEKTNCTIDIVYLHQCRQTNRSSRYHQAERIFLQLPFPGLKIILKKKRPRAQSSEENSTGHSSHQSSLSKSVSESLHRLKEKRTKPASTSKWSCKRSLNSNQSTKMPVLMKSPQLGMRQFDSSRESDTERGN